MKSIGLRNVRRSGAAVLFSALGLVLAPAAHSLAAEKPAIASPADQNSLPFGMTLGTYRMMMAQAPMDAAATRIQDLAARPGPAQSGFFETAVNDSTHVLTVYWHGAVPANMRRLISRLRNSVGIRVIKTRYSLATLNRAVLTAINSEHAVTAGWPLTDGSGIKLTVRGADPRTVASAMRSHLGVPVQVTHGGRSRNLFCDYAGSSGTGGRCNDFAPFWGGDVIHSTYDEWCTGGYGVHSSAGSFLLTAAHCAYTGSGYANGITFYNGQDPADSVRVGNITDVPGTDDLAIIPTSAGDRYYDGPSILDGDTFNTKIVAGQQAVSVGDSMCESGAFGGVQCGFIVRGVGGSLPDPQVPGQVWTNLALATSSTGASAVPGDSGGPWFSLDGCCTYVWAKGIDHGSALGKDGTEYQVFTPISWATHDMGVTVNTP